MADSEEHVTDSFIFIQVNPQGASRAGSVRSSVDGWSEISCPGSAKSTNSHTRRSSDRERDPFSVFTGTYLQNGHNLGSPAQMPGMGSDKGYYLVNAANAASGCDSHTSQENGPVFSSNSTTDDVMGKWPAHERSLPPTTMAMANNRVPLGAAPNNSNSIGSVGSRVPFSWAEITKIQPRFHHESTTAPKVFDSPTKIATRHSAPRKSPSPSPASASPKPGAPTFDRVQLQEEEEISMPSISETDAFATKGDVGPKVRRSRKRGSRLKYPNGKCRGSHNRNVRRKKNQK